jgi:hypothetical protein
MLFDETGLKSPLFYSEDFPIDGAAMPVVSKNVETPYRLGRNEARLKIKCL